MIRWLPIAVVVLCGITAALQVGKVPIALGQMQTEYGLTLATLSWVMSVFPIVGVVGGVATGMVVERVGDRRVVCAGMLIISAASVLGALSHGFAWLIATRIAEGMGFLLVVVAAPAVLQRLTPRAKQPLVFGVWSTFMPVGITVSMLLGSHLGGWRSVWLVYAALVFLTLLAFLASVPAAQRRAQVQSLSAAIEKAKTTLRSRQTWWLALSFAVYALQFFAILSFLPIFLGQRMNLSPSAAAAITAAVVGINIVGNLSAGLLISRGIRPRVLLVGASVVMGVTGACVFIPSLPGVWAVVLCLLFSAVGGLIPSTALQSAPRTAPDPSVVPLHLGLVMQGNYLGQLVGPVVVGNIVAHGGWPAAAWPVLAAACAGVWLGWRVDLRSTRERAA